MSNGPVTTPPDEPALARMAVALGAGSVPGLERLAAANAPGPDAPAPAPAVLDALWGRVLAGDDPLGDAFGRLRSPAARRPLGATYTPAAIVRPMVEWAAGQGVFARVVDPGAGSGRFLVESGRRLPGADLVAVEIDPLAALVTGANLAVAGFADRARVVVGDYRRLRLAPAGGRTLFIGNPPYVRHHQIIPAWKAWLTRTAGAIGLDASQLAGLHVHFFLATAERAEPGDVGVFITSAEWLDVNYGSLVRRLLLEHLGGTVLHVLEPTVRAFEDAQTTAAITGFRAGERPERVRLHRVAEVAALDLDAGHLLERDKLAEAPRWSPLVGGPDTPVPDGYVRLGELCRVHRGAVTGRNSVWLTHPGGVRLPDRVLFPAVTKARELFAAGAVLDHDDHLRQVIDIPADLDMLEDDERRHVERFLRQAKRDGAASGYIARQRRAWWSVGLRIPAPILATYMARRPPAFVRNPVGARHINIAHGLYPRQPLPEAVLDELAEALRTSISVAAGRTYAGGLTKFEPREMERLPVPGLPLLQALAERATR
jgi:adenine-specific DNA-methyltransferase